MASSRGVSLVLAILAILGTLGGTALGAWMSGRQAARETERQARERREARIREVRAAARLVSAELAMNSLLLRAAAEHLNLDEMKPARDDAWSTYGPVLAEELGDRDHARVVDTCSRVAAVVATAQQPGSHGLVDEAPQRLEQLRTEIAATQRALAPLAYPTLAGLDAAELAAEAEAA